MFVVWAAVMAALAVRSGAFSRAPVIAPRELAAERHEEWHGIYRDRQKIGYSHRVRRPTVDGFTVDSDTSMWLSLMGSSQVVRTRLAAETDRSLVLRHFDFRLRSGTIDFAVAGKVHDGVVDVDSPTLGRQTIRIPPGVPLTLSDTLADSLGSEKLESGRSFRYTLFDPATASPAPVSLNVGPLESLALPSGERSAYRIDQTFQGTKMRLWVDAEGNVLKEEGPLGLAILREIDGKAAMEGIAPSAGTDLAAAAAIPVGHAISSPRAAARVRLRIAKAPASATLSFPPRQRLDGHRLTIEREDPVGFRSYELPADGERFRDDLRATPFLQLDDPSVRAAAREAVGGEKDAERAARAILAWVYRSLAKVPTISVPNATQVLAERRGDCNEHAVLFAALARAAGIPTKIASGTVYMPPDPSTGSGQAGGASTASGRDAGAFYYHAWDEIWLGEWVAVDPTFGQFPADATHVKLIEGGPENDLSLAGMIGELAIEVEDFG